LLIRQVYSAVPAENYHFIFSEVFMETRVAVIAIIIEREEAAESVNSILHSYRRFIIGRMGIPYREKDINIISVAVDAPETEITAMSGKIGRLSGVSTKTAYSKV
jgi:putative iron-only hydrogenase system regulator